MCGTAAIQSSCWRLWAAGKVQVWFRGIILYRFKFHFSCTEGNHWICCSRMRRRCFLLEVFIRRPSNAMFKDGMSITKFAEINFPDNVSQVVGPQLLQDLELCMEIPTTAIKESGAEILLQSVLGVGLCCTGKWLPSCTGSGTPQRKLKEQFRILCLNA